jgi:tetratricopeptide (TPR) repeat protein
MENFKYRAFISYAHKDEQWGKWLHRKLEAFRVPAKLIGRQAKHGKIPPRLYPVFRDREELASSSRLGEAILEALEQSSHLIVVCSPHAVASTWVNQEIKDFKAMGRELRILYFIVSGEPYAGDRPGSEGEECFPQAAKYAVGEDGQLSNVREEPIAADAREVGDGSRDALLKVIAGLLGVGLDDLKRRALQQRHRKLGLIAAVSTMATLATIALATYAFVQQNAAEVARAQAVRSHEAVEEELSKAEAVTKFVTDLFASVEPKKASVMDKKLVRLMLDQGAERLSQLETDPGKEPEVEARLRLTLGRTYRSIGAYDEAEKQLNKALPLLQETVGEDDLQTVEVMNQLALVYQAKGDHKKVEDLLNVVLLKRTRILGEDHQETLRAQMDLATLYRSQGIYERAEELSSTALEKLEKTRGEDDPATIRAMTEVASVFLAQGKLMQAKSRFGSAYELSRIRLGEDDPDTLRAASRLIRTQKELLELEEAHALWVSTAEKMKLVFGEDHPETLGGKDTLAEIVAAQGDAAKALELYLEILEDKENFLGLMHPATFGTMEAIAQLHFEATRYVEAEDSYNDVYERMSSKLGNEHPETLRIMNSLGDCYVAEGKLEEAFSRFETALETEKRVLGPEDPLTLRTQVALGELHYLSGRKDTAMEIFTSTLETQQRILGLDHEAVARTSELRNRILAEKAAAAEAASEPEDNDPAPDENEKDSGADSPDNNASTGATADRILNELRENNDDEKPTPLDPPVDEEEENPRP